MPDFKKIWVIAGRDGYTIGDETYELLTEANSLSQDEGCIISVFLFGSSLDQWIVDLEQCGLMDYIYIFESSRLKAYNPYIYLQILKGMYQEQRPILILISGTSIGRDLAPRLAYYLEGGYISNVQQIKFTAHKELEAIKPIYGGKVQGHFRFIGSPPWIATLISGVVGIKKTRGSKTPKVIHRNMNEFIQKPPTNYRVIDFIKGDPSTIDISEADIIVAGGRGLKKHDGFQLLKEFANKIGGAVGCTRPIVDENILPPERQIGQTGKTVSPYLFISCGISGAIQHEMGMKDSKHIVAINIDPKAQIFRISKLKIIADVTEFLAILVKRLNEYKKQKAMLI